MVSVLFKFIISTHVIIASQQVSLSEEQQKMLDLHNKARQEVSVDPLEWSTELQNLAQEWADHLAKINRFDHRPLSGRFGSKTGENISWFSEKKALSDGFELWIEEKPNYHPNSGKCRGGECGHYTQVVWKSTTKVGCGCAQTKNGSTIVVCNYDPSGNFSGEKAY